MQTLRNINSQLTKSTSSVDSDDYGRKMIFGDAGTSTNRTLLHNPQNLMKTLYQKKFQSLTNNQQQQQPKSSSEEKENGSHDEVQRRGSFPFINYRTLESRAGSTSSLNEISKPKGILKNSNTTYDVFGNVAAHKSLSKLLQVKNSQQKSASAVSLDCNSNDSDSLKTAKHVTFNEEVSKKRYRPVRGSFDDNLIKDDILKIWFKQQRKGSINPDSFKTSKCDEDEWSESSEYESCDSD